MPDNHSKHTKHKVPDLFKDLEKWETKRRTFMRGLMLAGVASQVSFLQSCKNDIEKGNDYLTGEQATLLRSVLNILWPNDGNGPSIAELNTFDYIMWVLGSSLNRYEDENEFIIQGMDWTEETSQELYFESYNQLDEKQQKALIDQITIMDWGERWCSALVTLIMESLVLDPIYGCQPDEVGWKWLNHTSGYPRPTEELRFDHLLETIKKSSDEI